MTDNTGRYNVPAIATSLKSNGNKSMMQRWRWVPRLLVGIFCLVCLLLPSEPILAVPIGDVPNPRQVNGTWVSDVAEVLSGETEAQLNQRITQLTTRNSAEIAVVTVPDTAPAATVKAFATELFNTWGIGKRGLDNGVLLLVATQERRIEVETGRGIQPYLSDAEVAQIIATQIKPAFQSQNFDQGVLNGVEEIATQLQSINFQPFPFAPFYSRLGLVGIAISLLGGIWLIVQIQTWGQQLPTVKESFQNPMVFQIQIPNLGEIAIGGMGMLGMGMVAIAVSLNAWLLSQSPLASLLLTPFNQLWAMLPISLCTTLVSVLVWMGVDRFWLHRLTETFQSPIQHYAGHRFGQALWEQTWLILVLQIPALVAGAVFIGIALYLEIPSHVAISLTGLLMAIGYQVVLLTHIIHDMRLDTREAVQQYFCKTCKTVTKAMGGEAITQWLTPPELTAIALGNATYTLHSCDRCHPQPDRQTSYCKTTLLKPEGVCPTCSYPTVITVDVKQSKKNKKFPKQGSKKVTSIRQCQHCDHEEPIYPPTVKVSSANSSVGYSSYSSSTSSSDDSYSYSSSSSSDFGGGSSDGGGAGSDW
ncbi:MAG: TPM domain-containing protein [Leptolyngbyaceae bacterium]|nr:TPM domain-containing protein [Leptolyngbyaceae bacterium]